MKIVIPDDYQHIISKLNCYDLLSEHEVKVLHDSEKDINQLSDKLREAEVLVLTRERTEINEALLKQLPHLKLISQTGKISNHLDLEACTRYKVAVAEGVGSPTAPAELTWILIMNACRQIPQAIADMKTGKWQTNIGYTVQGKQIGIWGYGKIGKLISKYAKAFGADVLVWGSEASRKQALADGFKIADSKESFFHLADIVTLHLRLTDTTRGIVNEQDLMLMRPDSILVNTSRAELIEPGALISSLKKGKPGFAALDVFETEPIFDPSYELLQMPNVICTPHLGYVERNGYELYFSKAFENVVNFANGNPTNIANPEVLISKPS